MVLSKRSTRVHGRTNIFMSIPMLQDRSSHEDVDDVCKPRRVTSYDKKMLIEKCVTNVSCTWDVETREVICH